MKQTTYSKGLVISRFGMLSSLGSGAPANAIAMRCGYDGFEASEFLGNYNAPYLAARYSMGRLTGIEKQAQMIVNSFSQTCENLSIDEIHSTPVIFCLPNRSDIWDVEQNALSILSRVNILVADYAITLNKHNQLLLGNRCAVVEAFDKADNILSEGIANQVIIVTTDSLVTRSAMNHFSGDIFESGCRLLTDDNPNGFIPGEATVSFMVGKSVAKGMPHVVCHSWAKAEEDAIWGSGKVCNAKGAVVAIRAALEQADKKMSEMGFVLSSASGEDYFFKELSSATTKALEKKVDEQPLWLPASHIGETGTAVGGAMLVMAFYAMQNGYAPGKTAIGMLSDDDSQRAAFVIEYVEGG